MNRTTRTLATVAAGLTLATIVNVQPADADIERRYAGEWAKWDTCSDHMYADGSVDPEDLPCVEHDPGTGDSIRWRMDGTIRVITDRKADCLDDWHLYSACRRVR